MEKCKICNKEFKNMASLRSHINRDHNIPIKVYKKMFNIIEERLCIYCRCDISHKNHRAKYCDSIECKKKINKDTNHKAWCRKTQDSFNDKQEIIDFVICKVCGFKSSNIHRHITMNHNISLDDYKERFGCDDCSIYSMAYRENLSNKNKGENNRAYGHKGRYSPFSKNFIKYDGLGDEEKERVIREVLDKKNDTYKTSNNNPLTVRHWTKRGYSEEEARQIISGRQSTFSLEKCIINHGEEKGRQVWKERQDKWLSNYKKQNFSKISQELFWDIYNKIYKNFNNIYFATLDSKGELSENGKNYEYKIDIGDSFCKTDFFIKDINKIIEFDGDYWHGEARGNQQRNRERDLLLEQSGYHVLHIMERDYKNDCDKVLKECLEFIYG